MPASKTRVTLAETLKRFHADLAKRVADPAIDARFKAAQQFGDPALPLVKMAGQVTLVSTSAAPPTVAGVGLGLQTDLRLLTAGRGLLRQRFSRDVDPLAKGAGWPRTVDEGARATLEIAALLPAVVLTSKQAKLIDFEALPTDQREPALAESLHVLVQGAQALLFGAKGKGDGLSELSPASISRLAFGADAASVQLRGLLRGPTLPQPPRPGSVKLPSKKDIDRYVLAGALGDLLAGLGKHSAQARESRDWAAQIRAIGQVVKIDPPRACAGTRLQITASGLDPAALAPGADILLALPTRGGCAHVSLRKVAPWLFAAGGSGAVVTIEAEAPADVFTGAVGFFAVPPPTASEYAPGELIGAAAGLQSALHGLSGDYGWQLGQNVVEITTALELGALPRLPCAVRQGDGANWLLAGPPVIRDFRVVERGPVYPRGSVTLVWEVDNADAVSIAARTRPGSEHVCGLHNVPPPLATSGRVTLQVDCTQRWEGQYVLEASNANRCVAEPVKAEVNVSSGFAHWRIGAARVDITDRRPGLGFYGFSYERQLSSGQVQLSTEKPAGGQPAVEVPIYARAFFIEEWHAGANRPLQVIVVCDLWTCSIAVKREVLQRLNAARPEAERYTDANVLIAGTHTHGAPGGYSEYALYNLTVGGFKAEVFERYVAGIVSAIRSAESAAAPGRIHVANGDVVDCGFNRSFEAYAQNPEFRAGAKPEEWIDRDMLVLRFTADVDGFGRQRELGLLSWYGIHPTNLGMFNRVISGDNKGWAAWLAENELSSGGHLVVAAFGTACAGDVSGNLTLDKKGRKKVRMPVGNSDDPPSMSADLAAMREMGRRQAERALELYRGASFEVTGGLDARHRFVDMSNQTIDAIPGARTWPAAMGVSFGAGSSEDSMALVILPLIGGFDPGIPEGMTRADFNAARVAFFAMLAAQTVIQPAAAGMAASIVTLGTLPPSWALAQAWPALTAMFIIPGTRAYFFNAIGGALMPGRLPLPPRREGGRWRWEVTGASSVRADIAAGHGAKPIMFAAGESKLHFTPDGSEQPTETHAYPLVPHVLPLQLVRIGGVVLAGVPAEFTATAGRRLKQTLRDALPGALTHVAIANYANGYSGYVTTREEYGAQHYEGASTLYGEHTLAAYQQQFASLADLLLHRKKNAEPGTSLKMDHIGVEPGPG